MKNRATYIMIISIVMIMTAISVGGCFTSCNSEPTYELVPTITTTTEATTTTTTQETIVETTETTIETTETSETIAETTAETTIESNYQNEDIDFGNDKKAAETHRENKGGTVTTTKAPDKKPASTKKPEPTKKPDPTKAPEVTKAPEATKAPTNTPKPTEKPEPTATPVPDKGYATIKFKVTSHVYIDDESDETEEKTDYFEFKCYTTKYHSKKLSDYKLVDKNAISDKVTGKYSNNLSNYSAKPVEIVKFTN